MRHAQDFQKSAVLLEENNISKPVMVNIVFSCELYMKALLMWKNKNQDIIDEHTLDCLFNMFEFELKERIKRESEIKYWDEFLKDSSNAFCAWPYYYEKDNVMFGRVSALFALAEALNKICIETISIKEALESGTIR